jgi:hypothetical protein
VCSYSRRQSFLFINENKAAYFQKIGKIYCDKLRLNIHLRKGIRTSEQLYVIQVGMPSNPTDFEGRRRLITL